MFEKNKSMKKLVVALFGAVLLAGVPSVQAQSTPKIGVIDLKKVFDGYWKTKQADANLKTQASELDKKRKDMIGDYEKLNAEYKKALDSANDTAVSAEEREKRKKAAEAKLMEIREIEQSVQQFDRQSRTVIMEKQRQMRDSILKELKDAINAKAKAANYDMVIDSAAETANGTPTVMFWNGQGDITDAVLSHLNANAPAEKPATPADKPATTPDVKGKSK